MRVLLIKLPYDKVTWWTKSLSICLVIANMALKEYLMYYFDIKLVIQFLIGYLVFYIIFGICISKTLCN